MTGLLSGGGRQQFAIHADENQPLLHDGTRMVAEAPSIAKSACPERKPLTTLASQGAGGRLLNRQQLSVQPPQLPSHALRQPIIEKAALVPGGHTTGAAPRGSLGAELPKSSGDESALPVGAVTPQQYLGGEISSIGRTGMLGPSCGGGAAQRAQPPPLRPGDVIPPLGGVLQASEEHPPPTASTTASSTSVANASAAAEGAMTPGVRQLVADISYWSQPLGECRDDRSIRTYSGVRLLPDGRSEAIALKRLPVVVPHRMENMYEELTPLLQEPSPLVVNAKAVYFVPNIEVRNFGWI